MPLPEMPIDVIIGFDLDKTLVDSQPLVVKAFTQMAEQQGLDPKVYAVLDQEGPPMHLRLRNYFDPDEADRLANIFRGMMSQQGYGATILMPGAAESLELARSYGGAVILTAKPQDLAVATCMHHRIDRVRIYGGLFGEKAEVLRELGVDVYVGDHANDMWVSRLAGVELPVGVATGPCNARELREAGAAVVLSSLLEFPMLLGKYAIGNGGWLKAA